MKKYHLLLIMLLIATASVAVNSTNHKTTVHASKSETPFTWSAAEKISGNSTTAQSPSLATSSDGKTVLVTYTANKDPYYSYSTANGNPGSWQTLKPVVASTDAESQQINATFDSQGYAHLAWKEGGGLAYAKSKSNTNLGNGFNRTLFSTANSPQVANPVLATNDSLVHLIWAEKNDSVPSPKIYYMMSQNGGASWPAYSTKTKISHNTLQADSPSVAVGGNGNLHVVYQNQIIASQIPDRIFYTLGDISYNSGTQKYQMAWLSDDKVVEVSHMLDFDKTFSVLNPQILYTNGRLDVIATVKFKQSLDNYIYHFYCLANCTQESNWKTTSAAISGTLLEVNVTPNNITSSITSVGSCPTVVYDGFDKEAASTNEQIWNVNKCPTWGVQSNLTPTNIRALRPDTEMQPSAWWLFVTYQKHSGAATDQIYFTRTKPETYVYLPTIFRK